MKLAIQEFGRLGLDRPVELYTFSNDRGLRVRVMTYGATLVSVEAPDRAGTVAPITLSLNTLEDYLAGHPCLGSVCGRFANRIAAGRFTLENRTFQLAVNNGPNHLHGGWRGFDKVLWQAEPIETPDAVGVKCRVHSPDGDEHYPGNLTATVSYSLSADNQLRIEYRAVTDRPTVVNLTNHAYWNLAGPGAEDCYGHLLRLGADHYLPVDETQIPCGNPSPVHGTPMDFATARPIGQQIGQVGLGYDHCWVVNRKQPDELVLAARVEEPQSGRVMEVLTTQPGVQFYTGNWLNHRRVSDGVWLRKHQGFCLETQHFPDSPNRPDFPSTVLRPGQKLRALTIHRFTCGR